MKSKLFLTVIAAVLYIGTANAQITLATQRALLAENEKTILDHRISKYTTFTIDTKGLTDLLNSNRGKGKFRLRINDELDWTIDLELNDLRAPNYQATYTTDDGEFEVKEPFTVNTFKGRTSEGQPVRFTIDEKTFFGVILGGNYHYVIRPANDFTNNRDDKSFIVYKSWDLIDDDSSTDDVHDAMEIANEEFAEWNDSYLYSSYGICSYVIRLAIEADYEFHQNKGGSVNSPEGPTISSMLSIINLIEGVYESTFGIKFSVTYQHVFTTASDPYTSNNSIQLLNELRTHWMKNNSNKVRDIVHLFTGKILTSNDPEYTANGQAYEDPFGIGNSSGYSLSRDRPDMYQSTAHEIGHNLTAVHPSYSTCLCDNPTASLMCQKDKSPNLWFCTQSFNEISSYISNLIGICGPHTICYGSTASVTASSAPSGFTWNKSSNLNLSGSGTSVIISAISNVNEAAWVSINSGGQELVRLNIRIGGPVISSIERPSSIPAYQTIRFTAKYDYLSGVGTS
ncbi:MAG: zinc-dependent metalloprotease, partial [Tannerella sp.]|nr:zinc-dependent metalloprotease [Tannerella sp.]